MMLLQKKKKQFDSVSGTGDITKNIDLKDTNNVIKSKTRTTQELSNAKTSLINFEEGEAYTDSAITADYQKKANIDLQNTYNVYNSKKRSAISLSSDKNTLISLAEGRRMRLKCGQI